MLIPLELPPGLVRRGTELQAAGRWRDGSLVRWRDGVMQPVGGWRVRTSGVANAAPRGALAWQDNSSDRWVGLGTYNKLYVMSASGILSDITPVGLTAGLETAAVNTGFGGGFFGTGYYGNTRPDYGNYSEATTWALSTWGEYLIACNPSDGKVYEWQLNTATPAAALTNAPTGCLSAHVTEERFVFALGPGGNPRKVQWSDREDNTTWTPAAANEAGDFELKTAGQIMGAVSTRGQTLIVTDVDAHVANYVGPPFVYGFSTVGSACGAISRRSIVAYEGGAMWMGQRGFYAYNGGDVQRIPCEVTDFVFGDMNDAQRSKIHGVLNAQNGEIWWFFPDSASNECSRYVSYNYQAGHWSFGTLPRTCGVDRGVFSQPIWFGSDGAIYDHEVGTNYGGAEVFAESGPISLGTGDNVMSVNSLIPDELTQADVTVTFKTRLYPNATETDHGPYTMAAPTDVRFTGRQARMRVTGAKNVSWRWGIPRIEAIARGRR